MIGRPPSADRGVPVAPPGPGLVSARPRIPATTPALDSAAALLLLTAGGPDTDERIRTAAAQVLDWNRFLGLAQLERAIPVAYPRLRTVAGELVPGDVLDQMRRLALVSEFTILHLETRLRETLRALDAAGIPVVLLKGAALINSVYASALQRPMSDIDLLVESSQATLARRTLLAAGWRDVAGGVPDHAYAQHHHLPPLADARSPQLHAEIHTALFPERQPVGLDGAAVRARAVRARGEFSSVFTPSPIDLLLHACLHFLWSHQGRFGAWRTIRDVDAIVRNAAVDWDGFVRAARAARGVTSSYWTFRIAELAAGVSVPQAVMQQLRPPRAAPLRRLAERHFLRNLFPNAVECPSVALDHALWELGVMPRWSGHGSVRPWDEGEEFVPREGDARSRSPSGLRHRGALIRPSLRYLATLF